MPHVLLLSLASAPGCAMAGSGQRLEFQACACTLDAMGDLVAALDECFLSGCRFHGVNSSPFFFEGYLAAILQVAKKREEASSMSLKSNVIIKITKI